MPTTPFELLESWLALRLAAPQIDWLRARIDGARRSGAEAAFLLAFGMAPRKVGRGALALTSAEIAAAERARTGWQPARYLVDQAARMLLVLALPAPETDAFETTLDGLFDDGDLGELVTLYQALPVLPHPAAHRARAAEGIRSNMKSVLEAVALDNPYPAEELDDPAWNQLVLKCVFVGSPLFRVYDIDGRVNVELAKMLCDYAHERWSARRPVSPELWRSVGPVADGALLMDLERVLATGSEIERAAVSLSARHNPNAEPLLLAHARRVDQALTAYPTWEAIARSLSPE